MKKFNEQLWVSPLGKQLREHGCECYLLALYLFTSPHLQTHGIYYCPINYIAQDTGLAKEVILTQLALLSKLDVCHYDKAHEWVWVCDLADWYFGNLTSARDHRYKHVQARLSQLPELAFMETYKERYQTLLSPIKAEQNNIHSKKQPEALGTQSTTMTQHAISATHSLPSCDIAQASKEVTTTRPVSQTSIHKKNNLYPQKEMHQDTQADDTISKIFEYWRQTMQEPDAKLDHHRKRTIQSAIQLGYTPRQLCEAISGCAKTPFNMGQNDQHQRYNGLHVIFKHAHQIDRFIHHCHHPPTYKPNNTTEAALIAARDWMCTTQTDS